ncbi:MAG: ABC transporter ATP-binding protein [Planctomycetota bacterium]|nr:ABC transporter ATP-binding protein [Planctomycetota bacterium]
MSTGIRTIWKILAPHARAHKASLALLLALAWVAQLAEKAVIPLISPVLAVLAPETGASPVKSGTEWWRDILQAIEGWLVQGTATPDEKLASIVRIALAVAVLALISGIAAYAFITLSRWIALRIVADLRVQIARHVMGLSMSYHGRRHFGDLLSRINNDVTSTANLLNQTLKELIQEPVSALVCLIFMAGIAPIPTLVVALGLVVIGFVIAQQSKKDKKGSSKSLKELGSSVQVLTQMFQGVRTVKAFRAESREIAEYRRGNESYVRAAMKMIRAQALSNSFTTFASNFGLAVVIVLIAWLMLVKNQFGAIGSVAAFFLLLAQLYGSVKGIARALTYVQETVGAAERLQVLFDEQSDVVEAQKAHVLQGFSRSLRFEHVTFAYKDGNGSALVDFDLEVRRGETLALVGASGSGKSTAVDLVARFIDPTSGRVTVDGQDLRDLSLDSWTAQYAMVGQVPFLFHATIGENIRYGKPDATEAEVEAAARAAGIHKFIAELPEGYATNVADAGSRLSGGQRQRITIARAFLKGAPILLLDEATSALDTESEAIVQEALERLMADRTVLVIAHRLSTIKNADRIVVLDQGRIVEIGSHVELLAKKGAYARLSAADRTHLA